MCRLGESQIKKALRRLPQMLTQFLLFLLSCRGGVAPRTSKCPHLSYCDAQLLLATIIAHDKGNWSEAFMNRHVNPKGSSIRCARPVLLSFLILFLLLLLLLGVVVFVAVGHGGVLVLELVQ